MGTNPSYYTGVTNCPVEQVTWFNSIEHCSRRSMQEGLTTCYSYSSYGTNLDSWPSGWNANYYFHTNVSCNWTADGYRLPTQMECMFTARGGNQSQGYTFSGNNTIGNVAWYSSNSGSTTHTIGTKATNELGIFDMSGNVWEWVWDIYSSYPGGTQTDPHGATSGSYRVFSGVAGANLPSAALFLFAATEYERHVRRCWLPLHQDFPLIFRDAETCSTEEGKFPVW